GLRVRYAPEDEPLGRGGGLRHAMGLLDASGTFLVINGDVLAQPALAAAGRLSSFAHEGSWFSIDSHADIKAAERALS
ncbi:MAG TPA: hypothetical protein VMV93_13510, partial [Chloroflexota bacterium]|nr:hypothetical protein [Chloroflexota bacterium]